MDCPNKSGDDENRAALRFLIRHAPARPGHPFCGAMDGPDKPGHDDSG
jgi:hypothetical protein